MAWVQASAAAMCKTLATKVQGTPAKAASITTSLSGRSWGAAKLCSIPGMR